MKGSPTVKLVITALLGFAVVTAGCSTPDATNASPADGSTSVAPTTSAVVISTHPDLLPSPESGVVDSDQGEGVLLGPWLLVSGSVDDQPIPTDSVMDLRFDGTYLFFPLSCNSGSVPYEISGTSIEFDLDFFATTEERCATDPTYPPDVQAHLFETGLRRVETATISDNKRQLELAGDGVTMRFFARGIGG